MLTYIVLFYDFLPILKKCLLLAASLVDHLNLTFTCECKSLWSPEDHLCVLVSSSRTLFPSLHGDRVSPWPRAHQLGWTGSPVSPTVFLSQRPFHCWDCKCKPPCETLLGLELRSSCFYQMIYFSKPCI